MMTLERATHTTKDAHLTYHLREESRIVATIDQLKSGEWVVYRNGSKSRRFPHLTAALVRAL